MFQMPAARDWIFSVKAFLAAMLALYIALALGLSRPYWAMATVYIVAHPLTGATRSKALYRVLGTLLGAGAAVFMVPLLVNAPELLTAAMALWTGTLLYVALLHRTPRSYVFMLAAYTLPLIALPALGAPDGVFDIAVARAEEIILGIVCASIVGAVVMPSNVATVFAEKSAQWLTDAGRWATDMLSPDHDSEVARHHSRHRLAADILALDQLIGQLSYDAESAQRVRDARELRGRMTMLLPVLSSLTAIVDTLRAHARGLPDDLARRMADVAAWIRDGDAAALPVQPGQAPAPVASGNNGIAGEGGSNRIGEEHDGTGWHAALASAAEDRLRSLTELWQDCSTLRGRISEPATSRAFAPAFRHWEVGSARHYDHGMLLFSTASAALAIFLLGMIWIWTGWADGGSAVALGAISCCFFAAMDEPAPMIRSFFWWTVFSLAVAAVYVFFVLTNVHDFGLLVALFAIPYLLIGLMLAQPRLSLLALPLAANTANFVGIQGGYSTDFSAYFNGNLAGVAGILFALVWTLSTRPFGARVAMRRLIRSSWRGIAVNALGRDPASHIRLRARLLDRLSQLVPRLAASDNEVSTDGFTEVRVELSALALQRELPALHADKRESVEQVLQGVAAYYRERLEHPGRVPAPGLGTHLNTAIRALGVQTDQASRSARAALVDIQVALFSTLTNKRLTNER